jgi:hypothetical protein
LDRDFLSAMAEPERLVLPTHPDVREWHRCQRRRDAWRKVVSQPAQWVSAVQTVAPPQELPTILLAQTDESELLQAQSLPVQ